MISFTGHMTTFLVPEYVNLPMRYDLKIDKIIVVAYQCRETVGEERATRNPIQFHRAPRKEEEQ